ncbi:MAG: PEGA domain-containing protein [Patescibacteria group bacterium]|nr:PEGA domain-containing protein [Patescibacteria group bacterium]
MTKIQRRLYMLFFVALFLVTAPVLVLFAQGYRFDRIGKIFVYSGSVTVKSWPREIDLFIDGKKKDKKNLNVINNSYTVNGVRPGKHTIRCEKEGYTSWSKEIEVHSGISTEFWNVVLFPLDNRDLVKYETGQIDQYFISPRDKNEIVFFTKNDDDTLVSLLNIKEKTVEKIYSTKKFQFLGSTFEENVEWSSDNKRILIPFSLDGKKNYVIARVKKEDLQDVINFNDLFDKEINEFSIDKTETLTNNANVEAEDSTEFEKVRWMFNKNDELVALTKDYELFYIDINKPGEKLLIDTQVSGFDFAENRIYYTQMSNNIVWEIKEDNLDSKRQITNQPIDAPENTFVKLTVYDQYRLAIETSKSELFVYNDEKEKKETSMEKISKKIKGVQFSNDGKKMLYWTTNEIWCLILREWKVQPIRQKGNRIFVTRFSAPVQNVQWMDDYENLLFTVGNSVKSANIDTRWGTHIIDVYSVENNLSNRDILYDKQNQLLFARTKKDQTHKLQTIQLIDKGFFGF